MFFTSEIITPGGISIQSLLCQSECQYQTNWNVAGGKSLVLWTIKITHHPSVSYQWNSRHLNSQSTFACLMAGCISPVFHGSPISSCVLVVVRTLPALPVSATPVFWWNGGGSVLVAASWGTIRWGLWIGSGQSIIPVFHFCQEKLTCFPVPALDWGIPL